MPNPQALTSFQALSAFAAGTLAPGSRILDAGNRVALNIDALEALAASGLLAGIDLANGGRPAMVVTEAQRTGAATALSLIATPFDLQQRITAAEAATATLQPGFNSLAVWDSAAAVAANLPAIQALWRDGRLGLVRLSDAGRPSFSLSAAEVAANIDALRLIGSPFSIALTDPGTPTITLPVWASGQANYNTVIASIVTPHTLALGGVIRPATVAAVLSGVDRPTNAETALPANPTSPLGGTSVANLPAGLTVLDYQSQVTSYLESLHIAAQAGRIERIVMRDGGLQVVSLSPAELTSHAATVALFSPNVQLSQIIAAADAAGAVRDPRFANFTVQDSLANILAHLPAVDALMRQGQLGKLRFTDATADIVLTAAQLGQAALALSVAFENPLTITLSDAGKPSVTVAGDVLAVGAVRSNVLARVTGDYSLVVDGPISGSRAQAIVNAGGKVLDSLAAVRVADFGVTIATGGILAALQTLAASGKLTGIQVLNTGTQALGLSAGQIGANGAALALIEGPVVFGAAALAAQSMSAANLLLNLASLRAQADALTLDTISLSDAGANFSVSAAVLSQNIDVFRRIVNEYSITLTDPGTPTVTLLPSQVREGSFGVLARITNGPVNLQVDKALSATQASAIVNAGQVGRLVGAVTVVDFASNVFSGAPGLKALADGGRLAKTVLLDAGVVRFWGNAGYFTANQAAFDAIVSPFSQSVNVAAAAAATTAISGNFDSLHVTDTAAAIVANLAALQMLAVNGTLAGISGLTGAISLSAAEVAANAQALLRAGTGYTITLTDAGTPTITLRNWQVGADIATLLGRISSPYVLEVAGDLRPNRAATLVSAGATVVDSLAVNALVIRDSTGNIASQLPSLLTLANAGKIASIDTRGGRPLLRFAPGAESTYAPVLARISTPYGLSRTVSVADLATAILPAGFDGFSVVDSVANVLAGLAAIQAEAASGRLVQLSFTDAVGRVVTNAAGISSHAEAWMAATDAVPYVLTDSGTPTITIPGHGLGNFNLRNNVLDSIATPYSLAVTGRVTPGAAMAVVADNNRVLASLSGKLKVAGFSWDIGPALPALETLARAGRLEMLDIIDNALSTLSLPATGLADYAGALAAIDVPVRLETPSGSFIRSTLANLEKKPLGEFAPGGVLHLADMPFAPAAGSSFAYAGETLEVRRAGATLATATLTAPGGLAYDAGSFYLAPDSAGGTRVQVTTAPLAVTRIDPLSGAIDGSFVTGGTFYDGAVGYLQREFINPTGARVNVAANIPNVFLHGGGLHEGNALQALSGNNVLDGGIGSNFLVGGIGDDTFFLDGRTGKVSWGTLVNFNKGDAVTFWGWNEATTFDWFANEGADGFKGATIHARLNGGSGAYDASITFAGVGLATAQGFAFTTGVVDGNRYAYVQSL